MGWLIATTPKNAAFHAVQCVNLLVALIGTMTNSVHGWILTGFAEALLACAIGANAVMKMNSNSVNGIGE